jgi:hypothetical protein
MRCTKQFPAKPGGDDYLPERQLWGRKADLKIHIPFGKIPVRGKVA